MISQSPSDIALNETPAQSPLSGDSEISQVGSENASNNFINNLPNDKNLLKNTDMIQNNEQTLSEVDNNVSSTTESDKVQNSSKLGENELETRRKSENELNTFQTNKISLENQHNSSELGDNELEIHRKTTHIPETLSVDVDLCQDNGQSSSRSTSPVSSSGGISDCGSSTDEAPNPGKSPLLCAYFEIAFGPSILCCFVFEI